MIPLGLAAYHYGPGQKRLELDHAGDALAKARKAVADEDWDTAIESYQDALGKLPKEKHETSIRIQIEIAKAKIQNAGLPEAREDLAELVANLNTDDTVSPELKGEALSALANSRYYMTYLMKLEGRPESDWVPEIDAARQEYKYLAEISTKKEKHLNDLEAAIRLARAEPKDLYGLPIPKP